MDDKLVTLAIHTYERAEILKTILESRGIEVCLHNVNLIQPVVSAGVRVRIKEIDLPAALKIIESMPLFEDESVQKEENRPKIILIPIDFSSYSNHACELGFNYANEIGASVVIMHIYYTPFFPSTISLGESFSYQTKDEEAAIAIAEKAKKDLGEFSTFIRQKIKSKEWPDVAFATVLCEGLPEEEIVSYSNEYKPVMIIMGTRGKNQKDVDLIGSVTAEVIEMSKYPICTIPENANLRTFSEVKRIAFGTNFEQKDLIAADTLLKMFDHSQVHFYFFHVTNKHDTWNEIKLGGIKEYFEKQYPDTKIHYELIYADDFVLNLEKFIRNNTIDLISLTTHKRNIFARMFNPSMARKMLFHTDIPMLVLLP